MAAAPAPGRGGPPGPGPAGERNIPRRQDAYSVPGDYLINNDKFGFNLGAIFEKYRPNRTDNPLKINEKYSHLREAVQHELDAELSKVFVTLRRRDAEIFRLITKIKNEFIADQNDPAVTNIQKTSNKARNIKGNLDQLNRLIDAYFRNNRSHGYDRRGFIERNLRGAPNLNQNVTSIPIDYRFALRTTMDDTHIHEGDVGQTDDMNIANPADREIVEQRLRNCYILEHQYLRKHQELLNVFAFSLNLFEKYNNALSLLMFLIKYLVQYNTDLKNKDGTYDTTCRVKIPKPVITNMDILLRDQANIQRIISEMNENLNGNQNLGIDQNTTINPARERLATAADEPPTNDIGRGHQVMAREISANGRPPRVVPTNQQNINAQRDANTAVTRLGRTNPPGNSS